MRIWFDTEFHENGSTIDLISIGAVREDGKEYYAEVRGSDAIALRTPWLKDNVWPHLLGPGAQKSKMEIAADLFSFFEAKPEIWAFYADYDWVALCQLFGTMMSLPEGWPMFCLDIKQYATMLGNPELPDPTSADHHALNDAIWAKQAWQFLERSRTLTNYDRVHIDACRHLLKNNAPISVGGARILISMIDKLENSLRLHGGDCASLSTELEMARSERDWAAIDAARTMREMVARFVEQGGDATTAQSIRANWNPSWGEDPGAWLGNIPKRLS